MPVSGPLLRRLMAAGVTGDDLAEVVEMIDAEMATAVATTPATNPRASNAARQARYRARLRGEVTESDVTSDATSDPSLRNERPPKNNIKPPVTSLRSDIQPRREQFAGIWAVLPKRIGSNPKQPAEEKFYRLLKASTDPDALAAEILDGARRFAAWADGQDPKFNPQAVTWLNQGRWKDDYSRITAPRARAGPADRSEKRNGFIQTLQGDRRLL